MARSTMSFLGLYNYNNTLFDNFTVPEGVQKEQVIEMLLLESAELEVVYPDWDIMEHALRVWSAMESPVWQKLYETTKLEYDPISNYDRNEEWTDTSTAENKTTNTGNGKNTVTENATTTGTASSTASNVAYNTYDFKDTNKTTGTNSGTNTGTTTTDNTDSSNSTSNGTGSGTHKGRVWGNVGVTTSQKMISEQRDIVKFCIEDYIKEQTILHFCLLVY